MTSPPPHPRLELVYEDEGFLALQPHWDALLERSNVRTPFMSWDWMHQWWLHSRESTQLSIGVARDHQGAVLGIAPLCVNRLGGGPRGMLRHLTFLGGAGHICSEGLDFIVSAGQEERITLLLCQVFARTRLGWDVIDLPVIHDESPNRPIFEKALRAFDRSGARNPPHLSHSLELPGSWEDYLASVSGNRRNDHRSKWRKFSQQHAGRALQAGRDIGIEAAMDALFSLHGMRFSPAESTFLAPDAQAFHRAIARRWIDDGRVMVSLLEVDGKLAAARHGFVWNNRYWDYQSGFDDTHAALSIGNLNLAWTVQNAILRGLSEYDHLSGDQPYKRAWSSRVRHLHHLEAFNPRSPAAIVFRLVRSAKRLASRTTAEAAA